LGFSSPTAREWHRLIFQDGLTISTNLFGTTFYSLVGLHAGHVVVGLLMLMVILLCAFRGALKPTHTERVELVSWYWHFVDVVWFVVLTVVTSWVAKRRGGMQGSEEQVSEAPGGRKIELPAATPAPLVTAFGITLLGAGLLTDASVSIVGALLTLVGAVGWWRAVLPIAQVERFSVAPTPKAPEFAIPGAAANAGRRVAAPDQNRLRLPLEVPPYSAGITGGIAGGVAMATVALAYGLLAQQSLWYPINLLAAGAMPSMAAATTTELGAFNSTAFLVALLAHGTISLLVGLLYVLILPMLPRRHLLWGGLVAPLLWTGVIWAVLGIVNPVLESRIYWPWFVASQIAFGLVAGLVVAYTKPVGTPQTRRVAAATSGSKAPPAAEP